MIIASGHVDLPWRSPRKSTFGPKVDFRGLCQGKSTIPKSRLSRASPRQIDMAGCDNHDPQRVVSWTLFVDTASGAVSGQERPRREGIGTKWVWIDAELDSASRARRSRKALPFARSSPYGLVARSRLSARGAGAGRGARGAGRGVRGAGRGVRGAGSFSLPSATRAPGIDPGSIP